MSDHDTSDAIEDGSVASLFGSANNYERIFNAQHSVMTPDTTGMSKNQSKKALQQHNQAVRGAVGPEVDSMFADGSISAGPVRDTYQSSHDTGGDFGGERALNGVYGDKYVVHGHFDDKGNTKPGSVGIKDGDDKMGMRLAHGVDDGLGGSASELLSHWTS